MGRVAAAVVGLVVISGALLTPSSTSSQNAPPHPVLLTRESPLYSVAVVGDSYTTGSTEGGNGAQGWTALTWQKLARRGQDVDPNVAAEGRAGYVVRGYNGNVFGDLTPRAVTANDVLVVFFGSRNDQGADPLALAGMTQDAFAQAHRIAPRANLLVIGPPWPTADVPQAVLQIRDVLRFTASMAGATFIDPIAEQWFVGRPDLIGADGVHPNDAGHAYMAERIAPLISAQLPRRV
ncbi:MAG TPA: GDSL lipase [Mycobacterium sp.]|nr:GDSL lipase [Mycobacterium sp.]